MRIQLTLAAAAMLATVACNGAGSSQSLPAMPSGARDLMQPAAVDHTSVLKLLTTIKTIGSTVDPSNGDKEPSGLVYVKDKPYGKSILQKGDLVACNFTSRAGAEGAGTTIEYMPAVAGSTPTQLTQSDSLKGCASLVINTLDDAFATAETAKDAVGENPNGKIVQTLKNALLVEPFGSVYVPGQTSYPPGDGLWIADASSGKIIRINLGTGGKPTYAAVISGFAVNKGKPGSILGPSGLQYDQKTDTLYVVDGVNNTVIAFHHAYTEFNTNNEVVVGSNGTTFTGPKSQLAKVLYHGAPLSSPVGSTLLANGNLIVANTGNQKGKNVLVEIASDGKMLAYKNVNKGNAGALGGLASSGSTDATTQIYFNNDNNSTIEVLEK